MTITQLQETKKGRFSVFADGEFLFSVHKDTFLLRPELAVGRQVTVETLEEIRLEDEALSCKEKALTLLEYSSHSAGRLAEKLRRHYPPPVVQVVQQPQFPQPLDHLLHRLRRVVAADRKSVV